MSTHPYIPLYVDDYDAATAHLTPAEDGVYMRLMRLCWRTPGCSLPNDDAWIARKIRLTPAEFDAIARPVIAEFFHVVRGRLVQRRLKDEYDDISRKKSARAKAGKTGGLAKAQKTKEKDNGNASDLPADTRAFPDPEPNPEPVYPPNPPAGGVSDDEFDAIWSAYPESGRETCPALQARDEIDAAVAEGHEVAVLVAGAKRVAAHVAAGGRPKRIDRWAKDRLFLNTAPPKGPTVCGEAWTGPPDLFADAAAAKGAAWADAYLRRCAWRDGALVTDSKTVRRVVQAEIEQILAAHGARIELGAEAA